MRGSRTKEIKGKGRHQQHKGNKIRTKCRICKDNIIGWTNIDPICITCAVWRG